MDRSFCCPAKLPSMTLTEALDSRRKNRSHSNNSCDYYYCSHFR